VLLVFGPEIVVLKREDHEAVVIVCKHGLRGYECDPAASMLRRS
jgi:hypothetical protein